MSTCGVEFWFFKFVQRHIARSARSDFPDPTTENGAEFYKHWRAAFIRHDVTEDEADQASAIVCERDMFPGQHLQHLLDAARDVRRLATIPNADSDIDAARVASRGCRHCKGSGWASYPVHLIYGEPLPDRLAGHGDARASLFCVCSLGSFMRSKNAAAGEKKIGCGSLNDFRHLLAATPETSTEGEIWPQRARANRGGDL